MAGRRIAGPLVMTARARALALLFASEALLDRVAVAALFAIMLILTGDALGRYLFTAPIPWAHDVVSRVLLPAVFFFTVSSALRVNQHVHIDIVHEKLRPTVQNLATAIGCALAAVLFAVIGLLGARVAADAFASGERMSGAIEWPVWVYSAFVPIGIAPLVVRVVVRSLVSFRRALDGEPRLDSSASAAGRRAIQARRSAATA